MWRQAASWLATLLSAPPLFLAAEAAALTRDDEALGFERTPPRLAFTDGAVSFFRSDADGWTPAERNTALAPGDALASGEAANLELQTGPRAWLRAGELTSFGLVALEPDFLQLRLDTGTLALDLRELAPGQTYELATPHGVFRIEQAGYYRAGVLDDVSTFTSRRGGRATAVAGGASVPIATGEQLVLHGGDAPRSETYAAPELDAWDRWSYARTDAQLEPASARYVAGDVYGASDLDRYGDWRSDASYGSLWVPRAVPAGWAPYSAGRWISDPYYGWTWVDAAPWGWAPFHYGRWVYTSGFWGWCPGPRLARAYYAPALVAFSGGSGVYLSAGVPTFSWIALGWGEPLYPWWGPSHFRGHRHWAGWGGPRHHGWHARDDRHHHGRRHGGHDGGGHHGDRDRDHGDWDRDRDRDGRGHGGGHNGDRHRDFRNYRNANVHNGIVDSDRRHFARRSEPGDWRPDRDTRRGSDPQPAQRAGRGDTDRRGRSAGLAPRDDGRPRVEREREVPRDRARGRDLERRPPASPGQSVRRPPYQRGQIVRANPPAGPRTDAVDRRERRRGGVQDDAASRSASERRERGRAERAERGQRAPQAPVASAPRTRREAPSSERREAPRAERREQARLEPRPSPAPARQADPPRARQADPPRVRQADPPRAREQRGASDRGHGGMGAVSRGDGGGGGQREWSDRGGRGDGGDRADRGGRGDRDGGGSGHRGGRGGGDRD